MLQYVYDCDRCKIKKLQKKNGCKKTYKHKVVRSIECICDGFDKKCPLCHGTRSISYNTCPRNVVSCVSRVLPYFYDFISSNCQVWPSGSRYKSTWLLQESFEILLQIYNQFQDKLKEENQE